MTPAAELADRLASSRNALNRARRCLTRAKIARHAREDSSQLHCLLEATQALREASGYAVSAGLFLTP